MRTRPLAIEPSKLLYSAHDYGPEVFPQTWFSAADYPNNLRGRLGRGLADIPRTGRGGVFIGEFGIGHRDAFGGKALLWNPIADGVHGRLVFLDLLELEPELGRYRRDPQGRLAQRSAMEAGLVDPYLARQFEAGS